MDQIATFEPVVRFGGQRESGVDSHNPEATPRAGKRAADTPEFKLQAVELIADQHLSAADVGRRPDVTENRLHEWKKAVLAKATDAFPGSGHLTPVEEGLRRRRADVKGLEAERDLPKKATAFFATRTK